MGRLLSVRPLALSLFRFYLTTIFRLYIDHYLVVNLNDCIANITEGNKKEEDHDREPLELGRVEESY